jgi:hypothetical protein
MAAAPAGINVPNAFGHPAIQAADLLAPTAVEVGNYHQAANQWRNTALVHLMIFHPNHTFNLIFPNALGATSDQAVCDAKVTVIRDYLVALWPVYNNAHNVFLAAIQAPAQAVEQAVEPCHNPLKTKTQNWRS